MLVKSHRLAAGAAACVLAVGLSACGTSTSATENTNGGPGSTEPDPNAEAYARILDAAKVDVDTSKWKKDGPYEIAAVTQGPINAWGSLFDAQLKHAADESSEISELQVYPSMGSAETQIQDLGTIVNDEPDAIIITPMNVAALSASLTRAQAAGIPVITCQARSEGAGWVTEVNQPLYPNNFEAAVHLGEMLDGKGNIVVLTGSPGVDMADISKIAVMDALKAFPDIKVVGEGAGNWSTAESKKLTASWIAKGEKIDGVLALGMEMGLGAVQAFIDAGKPLPVVAGTGAMNGFNRLAIEKDVDFWSKAFDPAVSKACLDVAVQVLHGETVTKYINPEEMMEGTWIFDSDNAQETYKPNLADQLPLGPTTMSDEDLAAAGFAR